MTERQYLTDAERTLAYGFGYRAMKSAGLKDTHEAYEMADEARERVHPMAFADALNTEALEPVAAVAISDAVDEGIAEAYRELRNAATDAEYQ